MQGLNKAAVYGGAGLIGMAIGAVLGILFAPDSGKETRRKLRLWIKQRREMGEAEYRAARQALAAGRKAFQEKHKTPVGV